MDDTLRWIWQSASATTKITPTTEDSDCGISRNNTLITSDTTGIHVHAFVSENTGIGIYTQTQTFATNTQFFF
jgi:hypothetical protein